MNPINLMFLTIWVVLFVCMWEVMSHIFTRYAHSPRPYRNGKLVLPLMGVWIVATFTSVAGINSPVLPWLYAWITLWMGWCMMDWTCAYGFVRLKQRHQWWKLQRNLRKKKLI